MPFQVIVNGVASAGVILAVALGFNLIYSTTRFFHFVHGVIFTAGAYAVYLFNVRMGIPLVAAIPCAVLVSAGLGWGVDRLVYRRLRSQQASALVLLLASLGMYIALQNAVSLMFGDSTLSIRGHEITGAYEWMGARITPVQLITIGVAVLLAGLLGFLLHRSHFGRSIRAVASDARLALTCGIDSERVLGGVFAIGSALAGIAGILVALDVDMHPTMGMHALMMGVVAVIIGGVGSLSGTVLGALLLGMAQQTTAWYFGSQWQDTLAFAILILFLLFRPEGFLGRASHAGG